MCQNIPESHIPWIFLSVELATHLHKLSTHSARATLVVHISVDNASLHNSANPSEIIYI